MSTNPRVNIATAFLTGIGSMIGNAYVNWKVTTDSKGKEIASLSFIKQQTTLYFICGFCWFLTGINNLFEAHLDGYEKSLPNIIFGGVVYTGVFVAWESGTWVFAFKNWVIAREMPKLLLQLGFLKDEEVSTQKCCSELSEKGYKIVYWIGWTTIFFCACWGGFGLMAFYWHLTDVESKHENFNWKKASNFLLVSQVLA